VGEVIKRFTTEPINVSKTLFTALDLVSIQTQTRVGGHKVRRNKTLTEINEYSPENDEINVRDVYEWRAETDNFIQMGSSSTLEEIKFDRGWTQERLDEELFKRKVVLAYLIENGLNTYTEVAATVQAFINDPDTILTIIADDHLERSLEDLREMESVQIEIDPEKEELVPRPEPPEELLEETGEILENAKPLLKRYREQESSDIVSALSGIGADEPEPDAEEALDFGQFVPKAGSEEEG
jgi:flagellar protein FlaI